MTVPESGFPIEVEIILRNGGSTPAYDLIHAGNVTIAPVPLPQGHLRMSGDGFTGTPNYAVLHGGETRKGIVQSGAHVDFDHVQPLIDRGLYVVVVATYKDTHGIGRSTQACAYLGGVRFMDALNASKNSPGETIPIDWDTAHWGNTAT